MQTEYTPVELHLFEGYGIELEYMIVDRDTLKVMPVTDQVLKSFSGTFVDEIENGAINWSNELALHVIELKTNGPAKSLEALSELFAENVRHINSIVKPMNGCLLPTAMHPFMDPYAEMKLWPHERNEIYEKYNEIFDCRGHGWANLQSVHLNLPFYGQEEFGRLHAAIRLLLPVLPALAASSPIKDGHYSGLKDTRLSVYQNNQKRIPSICGKVIPEPVFTKEAYLKEILQRNYRDIAPYDPEGILQDEWLNSRGAIARFQRHAIEIRVLDIQECPAADLAILKVISSTLKHLVGEKWLGWEEQKAWEVEPLFNILGQCIVNGEEALITDKAYLAVFGLPASSVTTRDLWRYLIEHTTGLTTTEKHILLVILEEGTLSSRIAKAIGPDPVTGKIISVYERLSGCLAENKVFSLTDQP